MQFPSGSTYLGTWEDDKPHGEGNPWIIHALPFSIMLLFLFPLGLYVDKSGYAYQGQWQRGKREIKGQCWFGKGAYYSGHFVNGSVRSSSPSHFDSFGLPR